MTFDPADVHAHQVTVTVNVPDIAWNSYLDGDLDLSDLLNFDQSKGEL